MSDIEKRIEEIQNDMKEVLAFIGARDIITNLEYCQIRGIAKPTLQGWFKKGCPRVDSRHVSKKAVDNWASISNTRKPKTNA